MWVFAQKLDSAIHVELLNSNLEFLLVVLARPNPNSLAKFLADVPSTDKCLNLKLVFGMLAKYNQYTFDP